MTSTRTARIIKARPEKVYGAFMDPAALANWLPPGEMTGKIHELIPGRKIIEAVTFHSDDPAFSGEMRIAVTFEAIASGTKVTFDCANIPSGLRPEGNEAGTRLSLDQLARFVES